MNISIIIKYIYTLTATVFLLTINLKTELFAQEILIGRDQNQYELGKRIELFEDPGAQLTIGDIANMDQIKWVRSSSEKPSYGFTSSAYWVRFTLINKSESQKTVYLESGYPNMDSVDLFYSREDSVSYIHTHSGDMSLFSQRPIKYRNFIFPLIIGPGASQQYYMRFKTDGSMNIPLTVWSPESFTEKINTEQIVLGLFYGIFVAMLLYNLFLFISLKDINYIFYILWIFSSGLFYFILNGFAFEYLWPDNPVWANQSLGLFMCFGTASAQLFTMSFLNTRKNTPVLHKILFALTIFDGVGIGFALFMNQAATIRLIAVLGFAFAIAVFTTGILCLIRTYRPARYFVIAWSVFLLGGVIYILKAAGILPSNFLTEYAIQIGSAAEVILLSLGLGDRINILKNEAELAAKRAIAAQKEIVELQEKANRDLVESTGKTLEMINKLNEFSRKMNSTENLDEILDHIFTYIHENFAVQRIALALVDTGKNELYRHSSSVGGAGYRTTLPESRDDSRISLADDQSLVGKVYRRRKPFYYRRVMNLENKYDRELVEQYNAQSALIVPLVIRDETIAILLFSNFSRVLNLSKNDIEKISKFCEQIAGAVYSSILFKKIEDEKDKANELLLNILPRKTAEELITHGSVEPLFYDQVTILFTDFQDFTKIAAEMLPNELIDELDGYFFQFDQIIERNNLEKLKTIGDSYMCAGGLPEMNYTHAIDVCRAALEIASFMSQIEDIRRPQNLPVWKLRIGIHSGPTMAGVIGKKKFAFDVWGDTVNIASRMESGGIPGRINISEDTYNLVKDYFDMEHRGLMQVKNRGEMNMYFLNSLKKEYTKEGSPNTPNDLFFERYGKIKSGILW